MPRRPTHALTLQWRGRGASRSGRRGLIWLHHYRVYFPKILEHGRHANGPPRIDLWYLCRSTGFHQKLASWVKWIRRGSSAAPTIIRNRLFEYHDEPIWSWSCSPDITIKPARQLILYQRSVIWRRQRFKYDVWLLLTNYRTLNIALSGGSTSHSEDQLLRKLNFNKLPYQWKTINLTWLY